MGRAGGEGCGTIAVGETSDGKRPMQRNDLSRSLVAFDQTSTVVAVVELSLKNWLVSGPLDRKSTRLNSSHANISYALFCLEQKTQRILRDLRGRCSSCTT